MPKITIALDFDGTCVEHRYPNIGKDADGCVSILKNWVDKHDVGIILSTMRSGQELQDAVDWFDNKGIKLYGVQKHPTQEKWTESPKCHATFCIDDRNVGCPLKQDSEKKHYVVDWKKIKPMVEKYF